MSLNNVKAKEFLLKIKELHPIIKSIQPIHQPGSGNVFNEMVKNIAYQQVSFKAAESVYAKFTNLMRSTEYTPSKILKTNYEEIKSCGFSYRKTDYIFNIATYFKKNRLYKKDWSKLNDNEIIDLLTQIKGVGVWTVQMILIFELKRPDIFLSLIHI